MPAPTSPQSVSSPMSSMSLSSTNGREFRQSLSALLNVYAIYRLAVSMVLWVLFLTGTAVGKDNPFLFLLAGGIYLISNLLLALHDRVNWEPTEKKIFLIAISDFVLLQLIGRSSGIHESGINILLLVSVAAGSMFISRQQLLLPALSTLTVLSYALWDLSKGRIGVDQLVSAAWLCSAFFLTTIFICYLTKKLNESEASAELTTKAAKRLENINALIIERMQTGALVCASDGRILSYNSAFTAIFELERISPEDLRGRDISDIDKKLGELLAQQPLVNANQNLLNSAEDELANFSQQIEVLPAKKLVRVSIIQIMKGDDSERLIFVEDMAKIAQQAQQLKLSSLGTLTASIAHEIRNPIGAISHAAQLLASDLDDQQSIKLANIIHQHAKRCSNIIESITSVSQGKAAKPDTFVLNDWLEQFLTRYQNHAPHLIVREIEPDLIISFDKAHLEQVLTNLIDNAINAASINQPSPTVVIAAYTDNHDKPIIDVIDQGSGVAPDQAQRLFEPFFTTKQEGSGLGLYICRELCRANQTTISYLPHNQPLEGFADHCFRMHLPHRSRQALSLAI